jgi:hypothetical protein
MFDFFPRPLLSAFGSPAGGSLFFSCTAAAGRHA